MVSDLSFTTVSVIIDSWEAIRRMNNYEDVAGLEIFKAFFDLAPEAKTIFAFGQNEDLYESKRFRSHARFFVGMIDKSLSLLGPDEELLTTILLDLGKQHSNWGVKPAFYAPLGQAILLMLEKLLGDRFTPAVKDAWVEVYQALSYDMIRASR
eukprot:Nitzschia sp. Nitz4//scaffold1_size375055//215890//216425//NITZ4_000286-RA/size375055-augustus-gene-0.680-mRNA-1//1//CDS//3329541075//2095//frame0